MEKLFLATLWEQLLIITVKFGNKTKVFSENFGWYIVTLKYKNLALDVHNSVKAENKSKEAKWPQSIIQ